MARGVKVRHGISERMGTTGTGYVAGPPIRACLIVNPRSGRGGIDLAPILPVLRDHGWDVVIRRKHVDGTASDLARQAADDGCGVVVACGGDGTLRGVVNGLVGTDVAVGVLPGGTGNLWARQIGVSLRLDLAAHQLVGAQRRRVDVGSLAINGAQHRHFLLGAGLGVDGATMARVSRPIENRVGHLAIGLAALRTLPMARAVPIEANLDGVHWSGRVAEIVVSNSRMYDGFPRITPGAFIDDGLLDIAVFPAARPFDVGRHIATLILRRRPNLAETLTDRAARAVFSIPAGLPLHLDGSPVSQPILPVSEFVEYAFSLVAQSVTVLVPRTYDGALFEAGAGLRSLRLPGRDVPPAKGKTHRFRVRTVGIDTVTAVRDSDGRTVTLVMDDKTVALDERGSRLPLAAFLDGLSEGDPLRVKGKADGGVLRTRLAGRPAQGGR
jgi:YegS/Rv2252/BmrU family lipid kinase